MFGQQMTFGEVVVTSQSVEQYVTVTFPTDQPYDTFSLYPACQVHKQYSIYIIETTTHSSFSTVFVTFVFSPSLASSQKAREVYAQLLGKLVYAEWPHLKEVRVVAVSDDKERFELVEAVGANQRNMTEKLSIRRRDLTAKDVETFYDGEISVISSQ